MKKNLVKDVSQIILGSLIFALSLNLFLIPSHVFSAGFMGIAQLLRDFIIHITGYSFPFDIAGIVNFILNIVIFVFAYYYISKRFALMTLITIAIQSLMLSCIPVTQEVILKEPIVSILFGSTLCAIGTVITFNGKGSGGGIDVIGIYVSQNNKGSVGRIYMIVNTCIYVICLIFYDFEIAIYSIISSTILSKMVDHIHDRNHEVELMVFTNHKNIVHEEIMKYTKRGITFWKGYGGYTNAGKDVVLTVVTKDRVHALVQHIHTYDANAFIIVSNHIQVHGNFKKEIV